MSPDHGSRKATGYFTAEEAARIRDLRLRFILYPDGFALGVNYRRLRFARWLLDNGYLGEWNVRRSPADSGDQTGESGPDSDDGGAWRRERT